MKIVNESKNLVKKIIFFSAVIIALSVNVISCSTTSTLSKDSYYSTNSKEIYNYTLSNGIPVVIKKTNSGEIAVLRMVFEGGTPLIPKDKSGIEGLTLDLCFHGSNNFSYDDIQKMQYDSTFSISSSSSRDYSVAGIKCLKKDFDKVFEIFSDGILNPLFSNEDFIQFMKLEEQNLISTAASPDGQLSLEMENALFSGTSYDASSYFTKDSINNVSLEDVKNMHKKLLDSSRIKFVIVANIDEIEQKTLLSKLENAFGNIQKGEYKSPEIQKIAVSNENLSFVNESAGVSSYAVGVFDCPERYDEDYVPFAMSLLILDDILFEKVREENGALYSIGTGVLGGKDLFGAISAYKISDKENIYSLIENAVRSFPDEKQIEKNIMQYKNKYITSLFKSSQNSSGVASNIITSLVYSNSPDSYLKRSFEVQNVTAKQIYNCYKKYIPYANEKQRNNENPVKWIMVSAEK